MATVLAGARVSEQTSPAVGQTEGVMQLPIGQQPGVGGDRGTTKLQHHPAVEVKAKSTLVRFTLWVRQRRPTQILRNRLNFKRGIRRVLVDDREAIPRRGGLGTAAARGKGARGRAGPEGDRADGRAIP